ncbi:helix-turn-helix domain-containing protein [Streptomyces sp. NPDC001744]|uniref:helix-turn-helix domain-containing protein n=1 Tax=Streptomyces sp. NPDC001744 TaxID=3364606 RepID=UPI003693B5D9
MGPDPRTTCSGPTSTTARPASSSLRPGRSGPRLRSSVKDAAAYPDVSPHTLYDWRHRRQGPSSFRTGPCSRAMYRRAALDVWIHEQECADSRSDPALDPLGVAPQRHSNSGV